jgi:Tfp pilus assembly protein PilV
MVTRRVPEHVAAEEGFSLVEFMIAAVIATAVVGGTVLLATQIQQSYSTRFEDATVEEEARYALDWIVRALRTAGSNPYTITLSACPAANTVFQAIRIDPNGTGIQDNIRIQSDVNPPNGLLGGVSGACTEEAEDVTIAHDAVNFVITRRDHAIDASPVDMTEPIFTELLFTFLDASRNATTNPAAIAYARIRVTGRSRAFDALVGELKTSTLETEVRLRTR